MLALSKITLCEQAYYVARASYFTWIGATKCALKPSDLYSDFTAISLYTACELGF